ncbi:hypothetical protein [Vitiosangium sp. GDMCC 1.1324]|uniref:hypothetical protein n=1 Tax=Vitiosangium sp. (strain GDMCC 1.1324) TaxID=2138576 RepID=UPI0011B4C7CB|nr:hypothetical protein [Vitiosangium sp. GDMCC 1.1324]
MQPTRSHIRVPSHAYVGRELSRLVGLVLVTALAGLASAEPPAILPPPNSAAPGGRSSACENLRTQALQGYKVPGRKPDSQVPWEFFLGNASHRLIAYIYRTRHPTNDVFYNKTSIKLILDRRGIGDSSLLPENEQKMCPDIADITLRSVFEIKPHNEKGRQDGMRKLQTYLLALNRTVPPNNRFSGGKEFEGEILIQFAQGQYIWRLEWCTTTPGVTQYRWTRSQERFDSNEAAYQAEQWVEISEQELKQYGGWVSQAVEEGVERRERLATISGAIGVAIDIVGEVAMIVISTAAPGERGAAQPGGKVLPFPSKPLPTEPPAQLPRASGM